MSNFENTKQMGTCRFCGQTFMIETISGEATEAQLEEHATQMCNCPEAKAYQGVIEAKDKAMRNIEILFDKFPKAKELLQAAVEPVAGGAIKSVTVNLEGGVKGTLKLGSSGKVRLKKTTTTTDEIE